MKIRITKVPKNIQQRQKNLQGNYNRMALGGDIQTHGSDFSTGMRYINAGSTHEENPYEGVQVGVDPEGKPNLVEEGEVIFNDYVYSNRIELDDKAKEKFHFSKRQHLTYAEAAKKLEKEAAERPNDPISTGALKVQMANLAEEQERQKQEMQAEEAQEAFAQLSPEEQIAIMQQIQAQQQGPSPEEQAMMEQQAIQEQGMWQPQMSPEEAAMMEQQMAMQGGGQPMMGGAPQMGIEQAMAQQAMAQQQRMPQEPMIPQQPMMAYGGQVNRFGGGGLLDKIKKWLAKNNYNVNMAEQIYSQITKANKKENITEENFIKAMRKKDLNELFSNYYNTILRANSIVDRFDSEQTGAEPSAYVDTPEVASQNIPTFDDWWNRNINSQEFPNTDERRGSAVDYGKLYRYFYPNSEENLTDSIRVRSALGRLYNKSEDKSAFSNFDYNRDILGNSATGFPINSSKNLGVTSDTVEDFLKEQVAKYYEDNPDIAQAALVGNIPNTYISEPTGNTLDEVVVAGNSPSVSVSNTSPAAAISSSPTVPTSTIVSSNVDNDAILRKIYESLANEGVYGNAGFDRWAKKNNVTGYDLAKARDLLTNESFIKAVSKDNPALAHVLKQGYDYGAFTLPDKEAIVNLDTGGSWTLDGSNDWYENWNAGGNPDLQDDAWKEALEAGTVKPGMTRKQIGEALSATKPYQDTTKLLKENPELLRRYLWEIAKGGDHISDKAVQHALQFVDKEGNWQEKYKTKPPTYEEAMEKERTTNAGNYWKSIKSSYRNNNTKNFYLNDDGEWEEMSYVPDGWKPMNTYSWNSQNGSNTYNYYQSKEAQDAADAKEAKEEVKRRIAPILTSNPYMKYAGIAGPIVALGLMGAGVGKPQLSALDALVNEYVKNGAHLASMEPIGNYLKYIPQDIFSSINAATATATGASRAMANAGGTAGSLQAANLANARNLMGTIGDINTKGQAANFDTNAKVTAHNADIDKFNAESFNKLSQFNAGVLNDAAKTAATLGLQSEAQKAEQRAGWYNSLYGNINNIAKGVNDMYRQDVQADWLARLLATGAVGNGSPENAMFSGMVDYYDNLTDKQKRRLNRGIV